MSTDYQYMDKELYDATIGRENSFWWLCGKREIVIDFAKNHAQLEFDKKYTICDVGCGTGLMLKALSEYGEVYGVDAEQGAVDYCRRSSDITNNEDANAHIQKGMLPDDIPFDKESFDYVFCLDVLEHVEDDRRALETLCGLLKSNGWLILTVPARKSLWGSNDVMSHHFRRYEYAELMEKVKAAGLDVRRESYFNFWLMPPIWVIRKVKNLFHIETADAAFSEKDGVVNKALKRIFSSEKYMLRKHRFPTGVSLIISARRMK